MTKEQVLELFLNNGISYNELLEFFNSNVVIPRGQNRHPYAYVLHEWLEDTSKKIEFFDGEYWRDLASLPIRDVVIQTEYRIKPSEPVYEWQWYSVVNGIATMPCKFYTEDEVDTVTFVKIKETKRVRQ